MIFTTFLSIKHGLINLNYCFEIIEITESDTYTILFKMLIVNLFCLYKQILASGWKVLSYQQFLA